MIYNIKINIKLYQNTILILPTIKVFKTLILGDSILNLFRIVSKSTLKI